MNWSLSPPVGSISGSGFYSAPAFIPSNQTVTVVASSQADTTKVATAAIALIAANPAPPPPPPPPPPSSSGGAIRVKAGGGAYTDPQGRTWLADTGFSEGFSFTTTSPIGNTATPALYQSERYSTGPFKYEFSVPNGTYTVNLKFAEIFWISPGHRIFNVGINGQLVLPNFDPSQVGGPFNAVDRSFSVTVTNGQIVIDLRPILDLPTISAIEILQ